MCFARTTARCTLLPVLWLAWGCGQAPEGPSTALRDDGAAPPAATNASNFAVQAPTAPRFEPPIEASLLFISIDTLRADRLGCYGYELPTSPNIDTFAAAGHRFEHAYTVMPSTLPSHTAMMTSRYPWEVGAHQNGCKVSDDAHTLAERLAEHGLKTRAVVSAVPLHSETRFSQGFDEFYEGAWEAEITRGHAGDLLEQAGGERFFHFIHFFDPHTPYKAPAEYADLFGAPHEPQPPSKYKLVPADLEAGMKAYDAEIRYADAMVGELLDQLDQLGLRQGTIVVLVSDHGETLDESFERSNYAFFHGQTLHHCELHIPMILWIPQGLLANRPAVHELDVDTLDLLPTLLELLGVPAEGVVRGRSLVPLLRGEDVPPRPVFSALRTSCGGNVFRHGAGSVVEGSWHWICNERGDLDLFDQWNDPAERESLRKTQRDTAKRLKAALEAFQQEAARWQANEHAGEQVGAEALEQLRALGYTGAAEDDQP